LLRAFDLVHLGLGPDGHTASLVPGDPALDVTDRLVAVTASYQGRRRMMLTYPALARAGQTLWLVTGKDKKTPLASSSRVTGRYRRRGPGCTLADTRRRDCGLNQSRSGVLPVEPGTEPMTLGRRG
jgi:hypothetical protein